MRKNNKGFTLIEVLVAITIMGIITVMALPGVQQLQSRNRERKYEKYGESLVSSAKLYVDSNEEDIFGYASSGCVDITYKELETKALVKDYETYGVTCAGNFDNGDSSDDTFIHVEKKNDKYVYEPYITCTDKNGKIVYQTQHTVNMCDNTSAGKPGTMEVNITAASNEQRDKWTKEKQISVEVSSEAGLTPNNFSAYCLTSVDNPKVCVDGSRKIIYFGNASGDKSVKRTVSFTGLTGEFYFVLLAGEGCISDLDANQYSENVVSDFTIKIDNTPPNIYRIVKAQTPLYRLQIYFDETPHNSKVNRITYTYDDGEEQEELCNLTLGINFTKNGKALDCSDIYSGYITTAFTVNKDVDVTFKLYDEAGNSASYKTHIGPRNSSFDISGMYLTYTDSMGNEYNEGSWTNKTLHALQVGGATENRPIAFYEISKNKKDWEEFKYNNSSDMYVIQPGSDDTRYLRAVTDDSYYSEAKEFKIKFDTTPPEITFDPDTNLSRKRIHTVKVELSDSQSGPRSNCKIKYGWTSDKNTAPATYKEANFGSNTSISVTGSGSDFGLSIIDTKFYYLWVIPDGCYDTLGNSRTEKAVAGPFSFRG